MALLSAARLLVVVAATLAAAKAEQAGGPNDRAALRAGSDKQLWKQGVPAWCAYVPNSVGLSMCQEGGEGGAGGGQADQSSSSPRWPKECEGMPEGLKATSSACSYTEKHALEMAYLSAASYCDDRLQRWDCGEACDAVPGVKSVRIIDDEGLGAHAVVGRLSDDRCFLAFRGTDSVSGWSQDFASAELVDLARCTKVGDSCGVGRGFLENWRALRGPVLRALELSGCPKTEPLSVTGHSLGGAMATLALFDLTAEGHAIKTAYTFGSPRVGDDVFAAEFQRRLLGVPVYRVAKANDPVVYMPPKDPFHHIGREVYYPGSSGGESVSFRVCDGSGEDPQCQGGPGDVDVSAMLAQCLIPQDCGHLTYLQPEMRVLLDSESCGRDPRSAGLPGVGSQWLP